MIVIPFKASHLKKMKVHSSQAFLEPHFEDPDALQWTDLSYSAVDPFAGKICGCLGVIPQWPGRAVAWAVIAEGVTVREMVFITKATVDFLESIQANPKYRRVETTVMSNWPQGARWAERLGFDYEGTLKAWGPNGGNFDMYGRVRHVGS